MDSPTESASPSPQSPEQAFAKALETGLSPHPVRAVQVETTSICNFRCPSCPLSMPEYDRPEKHLSLERFEQVLDAFPTVEKVELQGIGEVFLNPCILDLIRAAKKRGLVVHTFSNASRIEPDTARQAVESGLDVINFSLDGADEPTFRKARKGGTLARYKECVSHMVEARRALASATPQLGAMVVLSKRNVRQIPDLIAIAEGLGMDAIIFTKMNASANPELEPVLLDQADRDWIRSLPPHEGPLNVVWAYTPWTEGERRECPWPQMMTYVTVEGDVTPCCNYYDSRVLKLGNVFESSGEEIWNGEAYRAFRRSVWGGELPDICRNC
ncbi:MAG TPA: radical SAM protein [Planctomycetes bacterium]|nr:radical SAM protein [Planctomycetota bacterium]